MAAECVNHSATKAGKGQGHIFAKAVTVAILLVTRAATAVCCCCRRGSACRYDCLCFLVALYIRRGSVVPVAQTKPCSSVSCSDVSQSRPPSSTGSHDGAAGKPEGPSAVDVWPARVYVCPFHNLPTEW